ncbi:Hypothetical protein FP1803 [Flavobacterium psychrophilum JIP02/86]|uniref:Uncharacterized protein n=1 Tax=Flavobacterium psychrophilum (strain ATCC 49511 / DSM 21280 / CIP 103535 / JIP02/86) TaxID=402612 RepID=A6H0J6_FLAPJ|nr:Hypothetical protein FP1803 [Flavobacterium psychrophilum JIP02/86]
MDGIASNYIIKKMKLQSEDYIKKLQKKFLKK